MLSNVLFSHEPIGIIGGQGNAPYAALLYENGSLVTVQGLPPTGLTYRVGMNSSGLGLIGGTNGVNAYAAFVTPGGILEPIPGLLAPGEIYTVAINNEGIGVVGGGHLATLTPYGAVVFSEGMTFPFTGLPANGLLYGVAINQFGDIIIGGVGPANSAYAALTSIDGSVTPLTGLPATGAIFWVSTNNNNMRFIGGKDNTNVYAAFVTPENTVVPINNLPPGQNYSVSINAVGSAIMGGTSLSLPYAALVATDGAVKTINGLPQSNGIIYNVSLNDSGTGLIAGFSADRPYGAFVAPDGTLTPLKDLPTGTGFLDGLALHPAGIGLVGGVSSGEPFAALAAPNGQLTFLEGLPLTGEINSTAFSMLDKLVPKSIGPFDSFANTQFSLTKVLTQHTIFQYKIFAENPCHSQTDYSLWLAPFANVTLSKGAHAIPTYANQIGGVLLGVDYNGFQDLVIGGGASYTQNHVHYHHSHTSNSAITHESIFCYASWNRPFLFVNAALWTGLFQTSHKRHSFPGITSKAHLNSWNLSPHIEISSPFLVTLFKNCPGGPIDYVIDPFVSLDWVYNRQDRYREHGSSGFNIRLNDQNLSIFRTELGLRYFATHQYECGLLVVEEKLSYVNKTPTQKGARTASFVGAHSQFDVITLNPSTQNLVSYQIHTEFIPCNQDIYASFDYQGEFGKRFQSHLFTLTFGSNF